MNAHESYVSLETAKLLKEAGFYWECVYIYTNGVNELKHYENATVDAFNPIWEFAPTLEVAQRWLREVKDISVDISSTRYGEWEYIIRKINQSNHNDNAILALTACRFYTYEEAKEASIKKALEIILEKGE